MAYATIDFAVQLYGVDYVTVAFDRDNDGVIDTIATEAMLEIVSAEIDSYLVGRVPLPLTNVPLDLKMRCVDMAIYRMCPDAARLTTEKTDRFKAAESWLKMVARNEIKLTYEGASTGTHLTERARIVTATAAHSEQETDARWFSRENLKDVL